MYKDTEEYKAILNLGYIDTSDRWNGKEGTVVFQIASGAARKPRDGDQQYIIQKSGYVRRATYKTSRTGGRWDTNGNVVDRFEAGREDYREIGLILLYANLGKMSRDESYRIRAQAKTKPLIQFIFSANSSWCRFIADAFDNKSSAGGTMAQAVEMIYVDHKVNQGIVKLAKELGI